MLCRNISLSFYSPLTDKLCYLILIAHSALVSSCDLGEVEIFGKPEQKKATVQVSAKNVGF